jgi:SAM-dependent methyltransferase
MHERGKKVADQLFQEWQVYEKLLIHDYMDHRAFFARLQDEILARFSRPVRLLDLGCGDLAPVASLLKEIPVKSYVGIDESDVALALAAERLDRLQVPGRLVKGDLLDVLPDLPETFDVILASFSLHHLASPADKQATLEAARRHLAADGLFALIDVVCAEAEPRERYVKRWIEHADGRYQELLPAEKAVLFDHVNARDFPVSLADWQQMSKQAGLQEFHVLLQDSAQLNCLVMFSRGA